MKYVGSIPVWDGDGDQLTVHEYWEPKAFFGLVAERRFELSTGETVEPLNEDMFALATGKTFTRV